MRNDLLSRTALIRDIAASAALRGLQASLGLAIAILLARTLGPDGYGYYSFVLAAAVLIGVPAQMGLPTLLVRQVSRYQQGGDWSAMKGLLRRANQAVFAFAGLLSLIGATVTWMWMHGPTTTWSGALLWALLLIPLTALSNLRAATLRGLQLPVQGQLPEALLLPIALLALAGAAASLDMLSPVSAMALHLLAATAAFAVGAALLAHHLPKEIQAARPSYDTATWMKSMLPLSLSAGLQMINHQADLVLLGLLGSREDVGIYRVAVQCAALVAFALGTINLVIAPELSRLHSAGNLARLQRLVTTAARLATAACLPLTLLVMLFGEAVLRVAFGTEFSAAHAALVILCLGQAMNAFLGPVANLLNMTGHESVTTRAVALAAMLNVLLSIALIPMMGIEGAAIASSASLTAWNVILHWQAKRRTGVDTAALRFAARRRLHDAGTRM